MAPSYVLVTGATGLIGAHVVDSLLSKGIRVRAVARSKKKVEQMLAARPEYKSKIDFCLIDDLKTPGVFDEAVKDVDGVIHTASPLNYSVKDNEKELIIPAIQGVRSILEASSNSSVQRVVMTSSFGAVLDQNATYNSPYTFTSDDWNPITYSQAADKSATPQDAYRGSKKFAELEAWKFMKEKNPQFDLVTLCPSMVFGPLATQPTSVQDLNESNKMLWNIFSGGRDQPLPPAKFNFWIDVRDLAEIHVQALLNPGAGGRRYIPVSPESFTYQMAAEIMIENFSDSSGQIAMDKQAIRKHIKVDQREVEKEFPGIKFKLFKETVLDLIGQISGF